MTLGSLTAKIMNYSWARNLYDNEGDECLLVFCGNDTIIKFRDSVELEQFAHRILGSLNEIREES